LVGGGDAHPKSANDSNGTYAADLAKQMKPATGHWTEETGAKGRQGSANLFRKTGQSRKAKPKASMLHPAKKGVGGLERTKKGGGRRKRGNDP